MTAISMAAEPGPATPMMRDDSVWKTYRDIDFTCSMTWDMVSPRWLMTMEFAWATRCGMGTGPAPIIRSGSSGRILSRGDSPVGTETGMVASREKSGPEV